MRNHGDPSQVTPTINGSKIIQIHKPAGYYGTMLGPTGQDSGGAGVICENFMTAASTALNGGQPPAPPANATMVKWSECMRANGVPNMADPGTLTGHTANGNGPNPNSPVFKSAAELCGKRVGLGGAPGDRPGSVDLYNSDGSLGMVSF